MGEPRASVSPTRPRGGWLGSTPTSAARSRASWTCRTWSSSASRRPPGSPPSWPDPSTWPSPPPRTPADVGGGGGDFGEEPLAPIYQENDSKWADVVDWTVYGLVLAEELGITQAVARDAARMSALTARDPSVKNFVV